MTASDLAKIALLAEFAGVDVELHAFGFMLKKPGSGHRYIRRIIAYSDMVEARYPIEVFKANIQEMSRALESNC